MNSIVYKLYNTNYFLYKTIFNSNISYHYHFISYIVLLKKLLFLENS